jgi:acetyl esterase/lipase
MQFNYRWHLEATKVEPIPYDLIWLFVQSNQGRQTKSEHRPTLDAFYLLWLQFYLTFIAPNPRPWHTLTPTDKQEFKTTVLHQLKMDESAIKTVCGIRNFRILLASVRWLNIPYGLFAYHRRHHLDPGAVWQEQRATGIPIDIDEVRHKSVTQPRCALIFVHGGAYCFRVEQTWRLLCAHYSKCVQASVFIPFYRLAPENAFPAALDDIVNTYLWLIAPVAQGGQGFHSNQVALIGESAGAGAVSAFCLRLQSLIQDENQPKPFAVHQPACVYLKSPWVDLTCASANIEHMDHPFLDDIEALIDLTTSSPNSWTRNHLKDILHPPVWPFDLSSNYAYGLTASSAHRDPARLREPWISPFFAQSHLLAESMPPVLVQLGSEEALFDEGVVFAKRLFQARQRHRENGKWRRDQSPPFRIHYIDWNKDKSHCKDNGEDLEQIRCEVYARMSHVFQLFWTLRYPPSIQAVQNGCTFMNKHLYKDY